MLRDAWGHPSMEILCFSGWSTQHRLAWDWGIKS